MKAKILRRLTILKLWKLTPFNILSWIQILRAYEKQWKSNFKDFRCMKMSLTRTLRIMIKKGLIRKVKRGQYQLTEKGVEFYKTNIEKLIKSIKNDLRNLIVVV